jgi:hypothetical protein
MAAKRRRISLSLKGNSTMTIKAGLRNTYLNDHGKAHRGIVKHYLLQQNPLWTCNAYCYNNAPDEFLPGGVC